jgi:hypothetical protein
MDRQVTISERSDGENGVSVFIVNGEQMSIPLWNVTLVGDYALITVWVRARDERDAEVLGCNFLEDYYDLRSDSFSASAECLS